MKQIILILLSLFCFSTQHEFPFTPNEEQIRAHWSIFKSNHGFHKLNSIEETNRFKLFRDNFIKVLEHNQEAVGLFSYLIY